ncbi:NUDIX domain-containing protein [Candidatus Saccharibacteria bacterium]|nr:NUDIX domain-containing protein [Candidatus Saccharibacteria bacterium]
MSHTVKRRIGKVVSPFVIALLKAHTVITGTQRSRIIVINESNEVLLVRGFIGPNWSLPGGGIEKGELPVAAARRELYEETGIKLRDYPVHSAGVLSGEASPVNYVAHIFTVSIMKAELPKKQYNMHEIIELGWFTFDNLPTDLSSIVLPSLELLSKKQSI